MTLYTWTRQRFVEDKENTPPYVRGFQNTVLPINATSVIIHCSMTKRMSSDVVVKLHHKMRSVGYKVERWDDDIVFHKCCIVLRFPQPGTNSGSGQENDSVP